MREVSGADDMAVTPQIFGDLAPLRMRGNGAAEFCQVG
jgi:hypothetical protein